MQGIEPSPHDHKGALTMPTVKLGSKHQITIPAETIKRFGLKPGEELELVESGKAIILVPRRDIPKDQRWYYTDEWQQMMQEAFDDLKQGRMRGPFESAEELIKDLRS
jgi:AbrB family looped-hinge helix DNA binding protein